MWSTIWATGDDIPRLGALVRTGPVVALCPGGDDVHPLVAVVSGHSVADRTGDRLHVWDVVSGRVVVAPAGDGQSVALGDSVGGPVAVTGHADGRLRVWGLPDLVPGLTWDTGAPGVAEVDVVGRTAVTLHADGAVRRWALDTGEPLGALDVCSVRAIAAALLTDGRQVVVTGGRGLSLWDAESGAPLPLPVGDGQGLDDIGAVVLSVVNGRDMLTVVTGARQIAMFDLGTGAGVGARIDAHVDDFTEYRGHVWGGKRGRSRPAVVNGVLAVPTPWRVHLWNVHTPAPAGAVLTGPVRKSMLASVRWKQRDWLLTGSAEDGMLGLWDLAARAHAPKGHDEPVGHLASAGQDVVVCVDDGGTIAARRTADGSPVARPTRTGVRGVLALAAWADGASVYAATGAGSVQWSHPWLQRWDLVARTEVTPPVRIGTPVVKHFAHIMLRGEHAAVVVDRDLLQLRRAADGALLDQVRLSRGTFRLVAGPSADGPIAVTSALDHLPEIFRLEALAEPPVPITRLDGAFVGALDGGRLIAGRLDEWRNGKTLWACDLSGHRLGPDLTGPPFTGYAVATWPEVYIARADGTVSLVDVVSGRALCPALQLPTAARGIATTGGDLLVGFGIDVARFRPPRTHEAYVEE
jgi:hypothetical protein